MLLATALWTFLRALVFGSAFVTLENLALRHEVLVLQRSVPRPRLTRWDRILWVWLSRLWTAWRPSLVIVQPATVLAWHRQGFRLYWRWRSTATRVGGPRLAVRAELAGERRVSPQNHDAGDEQQQDEADHSGPQRRVHHGILQRVTAVRHVPSPQIPDSTKSLRASQRTPSPTAKAVSLAQVPAARWKFMMAVTLRVVGSTW
jgi:hypothetical protein